MRKDIRSPLYNYANAHRRYLNTFVRARYGIRTWNTFRKLFTRNSPGFAYPLLRSKSFVRRELWLLRNMEL